MCQLAAAAPLLTGEDTKTHADRVMESVAKSEIKKGFRIAQEHWKVPAAEIENLAEQTRDQLLVKFSDRFGKILSAEFVGKKTVGDSLIKYYYVLKMEKHALRWKFVYYKADKTWAVNHLGWDDSIEELFDEVPSKEQAKN